MSTLIAVTRPALAALLSPESSAYLAHRAQRLDAVADALVLGADVVPRPGTSADEWAPGIDPSIAAITLAHLTRSVGLIVAAAPQRDHPYNLARRLASIDHASHGRAGLFVGATDPVATPGSPWTTATAADAAADAVLALRELWRSFPIDAVVGDKETGVFAESHRIVAVDHRGAFDVTGPLQIPSSPQLWPPVLAWAGPSRLREVVDVAIAVDDPRFTVHWAADLAELDRILSTLQPRGAVAASTLRERFGVPRAVPPTGGRQVFAEAGSVDVR